jgi:hypothetical protein
VKANRNPAARKSKRPVSIISKSIELKFKGKIKDRENGSLAIADAGMERLSFSFPGF